MTKEILNDEQIRKDVLAFREETDSHIWESFLCWFIPVSLLSIMGAAIIHPAVSVVGVIAQIVLLILFVPKMKDARAERKKVVAGDYVVITDTLVNVCEETVVEPNGTHRHLHAAREAEFLHFSSLKWRIPANVYRWSDLYAMSGRGLSNTSIIGDEFYLVILNSTREIACVYNKKLFDYQKGNDQ